MGTAALEVLGPSSSLTPPLALKVVGGNTTGSGGTETGGGISLATGKGTSGFTGDGSTLDLIGGQYGGDGGYIQLYCGAGLNGTGSAGTININNAGASANGGRLDIVGGNSYGTGANLGGNVRIDAGAGGSTRAGSFFGFRWYCQC